MFIWDKVLRLHKTNNMKYSFTVYYKGVKGADILQITLPYKPIKDECLIIRNDKNENTHLKIICIGYDFDKNGSFKRLLMMVTDADY